MPGNEEKYEKGHKLKPVSVSLKRLTPSEIASKMSQKRSTTTRLEESPPPRKTYRSHSRSGKMTKGDGIGVHSNEKLATVSVPSVPVTTDEDDIQIIEGENIPSPHAPIPTPGVSSKSPSSLPDSWEWVTPAQFVTDFYRSEGLKRSHLICCHDDGPNTPDKLLYSVSAIRPKNDTAWEKPPSQLSAFTWLAEKCQEIVPILDKPEAIYLYENRTIAVLQPWTSQVAISLATWFRGMPTPSPSLFVLQGGLEALKKDAEFKKFECPPVPRPVPLFTPEIVERCPSGLIEAVNGYRSTFEKRVAQVEKAIQLERKLDSLKHVKKHVEEKVEPDFKKEMRQKIISVMKCDQCDDILEGIIYQCLGAGPHSFCSGCFDNWQREKSDCKKCGGTSAPQKTSVVVSHSANFVTAQNVRICCPNCGKWEATGVFKAHWSACLAKKQKEREIRIDAMIGEGMKQKFLVLDALVEAKYEMMRAELNLRKIKGQEKVPQDVEVFIRQITEKNREADEMERAQLPI